MSRIEGQRPAMLVNIGLTVVLVLVFAGLAFAILSLPAGPASLCDAVDAELYCTGVQNPVTAVLLNFRGYDTLLEIAVLVMAVVSIWSIRRGHVPPPPDPGEVLSLLSGAQAPVMVLVAGYLLWAGADAPGGAFQAGAVLASAGIMLWLAGGHQPGLLRGFALRACLLAGLAVFLVVGAAATLRGGRFLELPPPVAGALTVLLEFAAFVSIGLLLFDMFVSVLRGGRAVAKDLPVAEDGQ